MIAPNGGDIFVTIYADCNHRWWEKAKDWLRFRRHPEAHLITHSKVYTAFTGSPFGLIDLNAGTIKVALLDNNKEE